nr:MAG TPA: hypothetical protein [Caudoviricetes sp.]
MLVRIALYLALRFTPYAIQKIISTFVTLIF